VQVTTNQQRAVRVVGAVAFGGMAVLFAQRGGVVSTVMAVLAAVVGAAYLYLALASPRNPR